MNMDGLKIIFDRVDLWNLHNGHKTSNLTLENQLKSYMIVNCYEESDIVNIHVKECEEFDEFRNKLISVIVDYKNGIKQ